MKRKSVYLMLCIVWMIVIFCLSAQSGGESGGLSDRVILFLERLSGLDLLHGGTFAADMVRFVVRKAAHMSEYAILAMLLYAYFRAAGHKKSICWALLTAFLYACSDEFHQLFVPGRSGRWQDVCIDTSGAVLGLLFQQLILYVAICVRRLPKWRS